MTQEIENILMAYQGLGDDRVVTVTLGALRALTTPTPAPVVREPVACADRGMCELHDRERRELLTQETVMGQRIMELERDLATATADAGRVDAETAVLDLAVKWHVMHSIRSGQALDKAIKAMIAAREGAQGGGEG